MIQNQRGFSLMYACIAAMVLVVTIGAGWTIMQSHAAPRCHAGATVALGQEFTIGKHCFVKISNTNLEVGIISFYNDPCPKNVECIWSGVAVNLEYRVNGEVKQYVDIVQNYGYVTKVVKSDYKTYASLRIDKPKSDYVQ